MSDINDHTYVKALNTDNCKNIHNSQTGQSYAPISSMSQLPNFLHISNQHLLPNKTSFLLHKVKTNHSNADQKNFTTIKLKIESSKSNQILHETQSSGSLRL